MYRAAFVFSLFLALPGAAQTAPKDEPGETGYERLARRAEFNRLAFRRTRAGALAPWHVKFLISKVQTQRPRLKFFDCRRYASHYLFARRSLAEVHDIGDFRRRSYFTDERDWLCGSIVTHDSWTAADRTRGLFTLEFWPSDAIGAEQVALAFRLASAGLPFTKGRLRYRPAGLSQQQRYEREQARFHELKLPVISTEALYARQTYAPLNLGKCIGRLRVMNGAEAAKQPATPRDIVIYTVVPNDLPHVAGVITEAPQTPLSHINLKARQNRTPNAYIKSASADARLKPLVGKWVELTVRPHGFKITAVSAATASKWLEGLRPKTSQRPRRSLTLDRIKPLAEIRWKDRHAVGAKAVGLAELRRVAPSVRSPDGFAVPFALYHRFMKAHKFYARVEALLQDPAARADPALRRAKLKALREAIKAATVPKAIATALERMHATFPKAQPLRCRSSTNNEDLPGFNGAGLYSSHTHRPDEGSITNTIKQVWASLWNDRAVEERTFHRIDHLRAAMGVLVHPNFDDELANGVVISRNLLMPTYEGIYVNVQQGESESVTNPKAAIPEEFVLTRIGRRHKKQARDHELIYMRRSSLLPPTKTVLSREQIDALNTGVRAIHDHFARLYRNKPNSPTYGLDIEFKIDKAGRLVFKQARPWIP